MLRKYRFLLALKLLESEIEELRIYSQECCGCFELVKTKLDYICEFMTLEENLQQWRLWGGHNEIREYCDKLRETSVKALCDMEKYHSACICNKNLDISQYIAELSDAARYELKAFGIDHQSKLLFIGAGAFPISALTIAKETGAEVLCLDIDAEAIILAQKVATAFKLESIVKFSSEKINDLAFSKEATHVIIASLVNNKLEVLSDLRAVINNDAKILLRYGNGLKINL